MEYLPPVGWGDVGTKHDLDALEVLLRHDLDAFKVSVKQDLDSQTAVLVLQLEATKHELRAEMRHETNRLLVWLFPTVLTALGLTAATTVAVTQML